MSDDPIFDTPETFWAIRIPEDMDYLREIARLIDRGDEAIFQVGTANLDRLATVVEAILFEDPELP